MHCLGDPSKRVRDEIADVQSVSSYFFFLFFSDAVCKLGEHLCSLRARSLKNTFSRLHLKCSLFTLHSVLLFHCFRGEDNLVLSFIFTSLSLS